jgi:hypothetical protein
MLLKTAILCISDSMFKRDRWEAEMLTIFNISLYSLRVFQNPHCHSEAGEESPP